MYEASSGDGEAYVTERMEGLRVIWRPAGLGLVEKMRSIRGARGRGAEVGLFEHPGPEELR